MPTSNIFSLTIKPLFLSILAFVADFKMQMAASVLVHPSAHSGCADNTICTTVLNLNKYNIEKNFAKFKIRNLREQNIRSGQKNVYNTTFTT